MTENKSTERLSQREKPTTLYLARPPLQSLPFHSSPSVQQSWKDTQLVKIYFDEIFKFLESCESSFQVPLNFLSGQTELSHTSRAYLIDWLVTIHQRLRLVQETLFISVSLIDRYLSKRIVNKKQLQLVGITAIFIASKYEEIYPPNMKDFLMTADNAYTKQHLVRMEIDMLKVSEFQITFPTSFRLLDRFHDCGPACRDLAEYILELGMVEYFIVKFRPSVQATAAMYLANVIVSKNYILKIDQLGFEEVKECVKEFCKIFKTAPDHPLCAVREKYLKKKVDLCRYEVGLQ